MYGFAVAAPQIDLSIAFDKAARRAGLTHDQIAYRMGITPQQLHQQLHSQGHLSLRRLFLLASDRDGRVFLRCYWPLLAEEFGMTDLAADLDVATALRTFVDRVQVRMARADLRAAESRRKESA